jgi:hypothetical protein
MVDSYPLSGSQNNIASESLPRREPRPNRLAHRELGSRAQSASSNEAQRDALTVIKQFNEELASCSTDFGYLHIAAGLARVESALKEYKNDSPNVVELLVLAAELQR